MGIKKGSLQEKERGGGKELSSGRRRVVGKIKEKIKRREKEGVRKREERQYEGREVDIKTTRRELEECSKWRKRRLKKWKSA